jgi:predicted nucleic acid binding AN1-type Zn finger protein
MHDICAKFQMQNWVLVHEHYKKFQIKMGCIQVHVVNESNSNVCEIKKERVENTR